MSYQNANNNFFLTTVCSEILYLTNFNITFFLGIKIFFLFTFLSLKKFKRFHRLRCIFKTWYKPFKKICEFSISTFSLVLNSDITVVKHINLNTNTFIYKNTKTLVQTSFYFNMLFNNKLRFLFTHYFQIISLIFTFFINIIKFFYIFPLFFKKKTLFRFLYFIEIWGLTTLIICLI